MEHCKDDYAGRLDPVVDAIGEFGYGCFPDIVGYERIAIRLTSDGIEDPSHLADKVHASPERRSSYQAAASSNSA